MMYCAHCAIEIEGVPYERDGKAFCCERCYHAMQRMVDAAAAQETAYLDLIGALVRALDAREGETAGHAHRVARYTHLLARLIGVPAATCIHYCRGALLHDIGKIGVPDAILNKPGKLDPEEWEVMRRHPEIGRRILQDIAFLAPAADIVFTHHEHYDGSGYPRGLKGEAIPLGARIFAVVDALDAITTDRPYHAADTLTAAFAYLTQEAGARFDPAVVSSLLLYHAPFERLREQLAAQVHISVAPADIGRDEHDVLEATLARGALQEGSL
jgi:HD-GYP domain-containing protein (c-di-GMP phosphodiesterase class II)